MFGLFAQPPNDNPTLVNNVETLANVPHILADGPDWLRSSGTDTSPGTMVFTVCGDVHREGVFELPLGTPLRYLVEDLAGGHAGGSYPEGDLPWRIEHRPRPERTGRAYGLRLDARDRIRSRLCRLRGLR